MSVAGFRGDERAASAAATIIALILVVLFVGIAVGPVPLDPVLLVGVFILLAVIALVSAAVEIVDPFEKRVLTVLGDFREVLEPGIHFIPPFVSSTHNFDMRTHTVDVPKQEAITRDNSPVVANAVIYMRVMDAKKAFLEVEDYQRATSNLAQTTLRAVLGDMELDDTLSKREEINESIRTDLDEQTDQWGVRIESVEVQEITPSKDVLQSMEKQTSAERKRRAMILEAQGERRSSIEKAEGDKQSDIIRAQGEKQAQILEAQGDALSTVLRSRSADAMGEQAVIDKSLETLKEIGEGPSETYVLPQEFSSTIGKYGKSLIDADLPDEESIKGQKYDADDEELLGLNSIDEILGEIEEVETASNSYDEDLPEDVTEEDIAGGQSRDVSGASDDIAGGQTGDVGGRSDGVAGQAEDLAGKTDEFAGGESGDQSADGDSDRSGADDGDVPTGMPGDDESPETDGDESEDDQTLGDMWDPGEDSGTDAESEKETEEEK